MHDVRRSIFMGCLIFAAGLSAPACHDRGEVSEILKVAPRVPPQVAWHLAHDSDAELRAYALAAKTEELRGAISAFITLVPEGPAPAYEAAYHRARPYWLRTANVLSEVFGL